MTVRRLRPGWMVAVVPTGVAVVGPQVEIELALPGGTRAPDTITTALDDQPLHDDEASAALRALLNAQGALTPAPPEPLPAGSSLAEAILAALRGSPPEGAIWTAEEALLLPPGLPVRTRTRAIRAFVAGLTPDARLNAYALVACGSGGVHGDTPARERTAARLTTKVSAGDPIRVIELTAGRRDWRVAAEDLDRIGADRAHRLGPILSTSAPGPVDPELPELQWCAAEVAVANLDGADLRSRARRPGPRRSRQRPRATGRACGGGGAVRRRGNFVGGAAAGAL